MAREQPAVLDAGPAIVLEELSRSEALEAFAKVYCADVVRAELSKLPAWFAGKVETVSTTPSQRKTCATLAKAHDISFPDAMNKVVAGSLGLPTILTDDLDLREASRDEGFTPVGTIGILLRAGKIGILSKEEVLDALDAIPARSSLYITRKLLDEAKIRVRKEL